MRGAPRPLPLVLVSMANADQFLEDGDIGLSVGEGHLPARIVQRVTGSPYVHTLSIQRQGDEWQLIESAPPRVRQLPLAELVDEYSGLYDFYRCRETVDHAAAWAWAERAVGAKYGWDDLLQVWRLRYRLARESGRLRERILLLEVDASADRHDPEPNSDDPQGARRDCSALWCAALRVAGLRPTIHEFDCLCVPGDYSEPGRWQYIATLTK